MLAHSESKHIHLRNIEKQNQCLEPNASKWKDTLEVPWPELQGINLGKKEEVVASLTRGIREPWWRARTHTLPLLPCSISWSWMRHLTYSVTQFLQPQNGMTIIICTSQHCFWIKCNKAYKAATATPSFRPLLGSPERQKQAQTLAFRDHFGFG